MYFTNTPTLNSIETIMKKLPYGSQRGGGRFRSPYKYTKKDCDCRLCLYYRKKTGCTVALCPVLDICLSCGAASIGDVVKAVFKDANNTLGLQAVKRELCGAVSAALTTVKNTVTTHRPWKKPPYRKRS